MGVRIDGPVSEQFTFPLETRSQNVVSCTYPGRSRTLTVITKFAAQVHRAGDTCCSARGIIATTGAARAPARRLARATVRVTSITLPQRTLH